MSVFFIIFLCLVLKVGIFGVYIFMAKLLWACFIKTQASLPMRLRHVSRTEIVESIKSWDFGVYIFMANL